MGWFNSNLNLMIPRSSPPRGVLRKRCPKNMQQIYMRTPMPKCDFNKVALQLRILENFGVLEKFE